MGMQVPSTASQPEEGCSSLICGCLNRQNRVRPIPVSLPNSLMFEVNPHRILRVVRHLPQPKYTKRSWYRTSDSFTRLTRGSSLERLSRSELISTNSTTHLGSSDAVWRSSDQPILTSDDPDNYLESLAVRLVNDSLRAALQEYSMRSNSWTAQWNRNSRYDADELIVPNGSAVIQSSTNGDCDLGIINPAFMDSYAASPPGNGDDGELLDVLRRCSATASGAFGNHRYADLEAAENESDTRQLLKTPDVSRARTAAFSNELEFSSKHVPNHHNHGDWGSFQESSLLPDKPLLFFVHGVGGSADVWQSQMTHFSERGYESIAVDLIGHGFSNSPDDEEAYTFKKILNDLLTVFDSFCRTHSVIIGHSYGSALAAAMSQERRGRISHLVLISGGGPMALTARPGVLSLPACLVACMKPFITCGLNRGALYSAAGRQMIYCNAVELPWYVLKYLQRGQNWPEGDAAFYKQITIPTLLIYGLRDRYVSLVEECEMEKVIRRAHLELIPEARHLVMLDSPDKVNGMIQRFLKRWEDRLHKIG